MVLLFWGDFFGPLVWFGFYFCFLVGWVLGSVCVYTAHVTAWLLLQSTPARLISLLKACSFWLEDGRGSEGSGEEQLKTSLGVGWALAWTHWILWERGIERVTVLFSKQPCPSSMSSDTTQSLQTKAKDVYKLLLMVKNIAMLSQFNGVITTFLSLIKGFFLLYIHQFSQILKELSNGDFLNFQFVCLKANFLVASGKNY